MSDGQNNIGIYFIVNIINNDFYIGSTINLVKREQQHFWLLRSNKHHNRHLQNAFNYYGDVFVFKIQELLMSKAECLYFEQRYLDYYFDTNRLYNICNYVSNRLNVKSSSETIEKLRIVSKGRNLGRKKTQKTIEKLKASLKGRKRHSNNITALLNATSKPVNQFTLDMIFVSKYCSIAAASRQTNISKSSIGYCCTGKLKHAGGYIFKYIEE